MVPEKVMKLSRTVWDKLAVKYDTLWVQRYSLAPTRRRVVSLLAARFGQRAFPLLDLGCATGQLLQEIHYICENALLFGIDKSLSMLRKTQDKLPEAQLFRADVDSDPLTAYIPANSLDAIVCCHSLPYYRQKKAVFRQLKHLLKDDGLIIFCQAATNTMYDWLVLNAVEKTAEPAQYLSTKNFRRLAGAEFCIEAEFAVKERFYMPSIAGFVLVKK